MADDVRLMMGDCLERMKEIEPGSVDLIACDLPYGTTACKWDSVIPFDPMWAAFKRALKDRAAVVLTASQPFTSALVLSNPKWFRYSLVWEKSTGTGFLDAKRRPLKCHEDVCVFFPRSGTYNPQKTRGQANHSTGKAVGRERDKSVYRGDYKLHKSDTSGWKYPRSVLKFPKHSSTERLHKTQKPVALFEYLILTYSNEGETVLDCCMGSGTTGVACINTGRSFIGIERDPTYFDIASTRISAAQSDLASQLPLTTAI